MIKHGFNNVTARQERHLSTGALLFQFFIRTSNLEAIPACLRFKALSSPVVKPFLVQEFESFVREDLLSFELPHTVRRQSHHERI